MAEILLEDAPRKVRELFEKAASAMERGNLDYAIEMFLSILDNEPRLLQVRNFLHTAQITKFKEGKGGALTHLTSSVSGLGKTFKVQSLIKKKPIAALHEAENLMTLDPLNPMFYNLVIKAALAADLPEVAVQTLETIRETDPNNIELLKRLAELYVKMDDPSNACLMFEQLVAMKPNDPVFIKSLKDAQARRTMQQGKWDQEGDFRTKVKDTEEAKTLEQQSKAVKSTRDVEELIAELEGRLQNDPNNVNYRRSLADLYARAKNYDAALKLLQEANEISGGGDPQVDRALSKIRIEQFDETAAQLRAAGRTLEADRIEAQKHAFLLSDAEERVKRYPNDLQFKYEYGVLLLDRGRYNEAIQQLQLAQRNPQRRLRSLYYLALCFKAKNQLDIAVQQLEKAASELSIMDDTKKDILYEMGSIYETMGHPEKAVEHFKEIYSVDIGYRDVAQKIEVYYQKNK